jgi:hypothetical protein
MFESTIIRFVSKMGKKTRRTKTPAAEPARLVVSSPAMLAAIQGVPPGDQLARCAGGCIGPPCSHAVVWKKNSNLGYTADNCVLVCCATAQQLHAGGEVNGNSWDRTTGTTGPA